MPDLTDRSYLRNEQYRDGRNLDARVRLHQEFSVNRESPSRWLLRLLKPGDRARILEVGGGPGHFWRDTRDLRAAGWRIVCTDLSPGMAAEARAALAAEAGLSFAAADAQDLPFPDASFDVVLANFMLYHVPDRPRALAEIRRVLRPGGQLAAATVGRIHMAGLRALVQRFATELPGQEERSDSFLLENAADQLAPFFADVRLVRQPNALVVTEPRPLVDYVLSTWTYRDALRGRERVFAEFVAAEIAAHGAIRIAKEIGVLIGRRAD